MHPALWKLFALRTRGSIRSIFIRLKTPRGAAMGVFTLLVIGMMLGPNLVVALALGRAGGPIGSERLLDAVPVGMLLFVVLNIVSSIGERALFFTPSEVDFLFPAPFSRREILLYKILGSVTAAVYFGLFFPIMTLRFIHSWPAAAVGFFLASLMISSLTLCAQLVGQTVSERAFTAPAGCFAGRVRRGRRGAGPGRRGWDRRNDTAAGEALGRGRNRAGPLCGLRQGGRRRAAVPRRARLGSARGGNGRRRLCPGHPSGRQLPGDGRPRQSEASRAEGGACRPKASSRRGWAKCGTRGSRARDGGAESGRSSGGR